MGLGYDLPDDCGARWHVDPCGGDTCPCCAARPSDLSKVDAGSKIEREALAAATRVYRYEKVADRPGARRAELGDLARDTAGAP